MTNEAPTASVEPVTDVDVESPTLIEGLPGLGMVASISVDQIQRQLELEHYASIRSDAFPPVAAFSDGRFRDPVRVYAGPDPAVMTLQSDMPIPPSAFAALSESVHTELATTFDRAIFVAGAPAESESQRGTVTGVASTADLEQDLQNAGITLAAESGVVGGVTGALVSDCYQDDIPAAVLIVRCDPRLPDPEAARVLIEHNLEPLLDFDIDTTALEEQAQTIQEQKQQIAQQLRQMQEGESETTQTRAMYQ